MSACTRHAPHPIELFAIQIIGPCNLAIACLYALFTLLEVVTVVSLIAIQALAVEFEDVLTDAIEKIAVVRHHQQTEGSLTQVVFEPFNHLKVQVIGRFVKNQQVGFGQ